MSRCFSSSGSAPAPCGTQVVLSKGCMRAYGFFQARGINHLSHVHSNWTNDLDIQSWHGFSRNVCASAGSSKGHIDGGKERLYQPELSSAERKAKRAQAHRMGKSLVTCNMGAKGITLAWLESLFATIRANQLVKVRLGGNDKIATAEELCALLDCVCVQSIGSVLVLHRQKGLPEPMRLQSMRGKHKVAISMAEGQESGVDKVNGIQKYKMESTKHSHNPDGPPEFTIIK